MSIFSSRWPRFAGGLLAIFAHALTATAQENDFRNFATGSRIPAENYCDQPYIVVPKTGQWVCTLTTGTGGESTPGQHVVSTVSSDHGQTWSGLVNIEPANGPESSWVTPFITPKERIYAFYDYNGDRAKGPDGKPITLGGWYVFKYSDDSGRSWSKRYRLPLPPAALDLGNNWQGHVQLFWGIAKPVVLGHTVLLAFTRMAKYPNASGEGWIFASDNLLTESNPNKIHWTLRPDSGHGIRNGALGSTQEEHNLVPLSDHGIYCVFRTSSGHPGFTTSIDGGRSWRTPALLAYTPGGRLIKTPVACPRIFQAPNGKYLLWFHDDSIRSYVPTARNLAWLSGGIEKDGQIFWSQPELINYNFDPRLGCSYPDLVPAGEKYYLSSTNKWEARVQQVDPSLLEDLWRQDEINTVTKRGEVLELQQSQLTPNSEQPMPALPDLATGGGFSLALWIRFADLRAGQVVLDSRNAQGRGLAVVTTPKGTLELKLSDGKVVADWDCDIHSLHPGALDHVVFIVDGSPKLISVVVDGQLCDGGTDRPYGYGRFLVPKDSAGQAVSEGLSDIWTDSLKIAPSLDGKLVSLRLYNRYLRTTEAIGNFRAGPG